MPQAVHPHPAKRAVRPRWEGPSGELTAQPPSAAADAQAARPASALPPPSGAVEPPPAEPPPREPATSDDPEEPIVPELRHRAGSPQEDEF